MEKRIKPIWNIPVQFKCPIIGACLTIDEHRKILKRTKHKTNGLKPYQMHSIIMDHLGGENKVSLKVDRYLKYKYRKEVSRFVGLDSIRFMDAWRQNFDKGKPEGIFFVASVRNGLANEDLAVIFGEIHMLSHANLQNVIDSSAELGRQRSITAKLAKLLKKQKNHIRKLNKEKLKLKAVIQINLINSKNTFRQAGEIKNNSQSDSLSKKYGQIESKIERIKVEKDEYQKEIQRLKANNQLIEVEYSDLQNTNEQLLLEIRQLVAQMAYSPQNICLTCNKPCSEGQVCSKKVLLVGGMTKMKPLYRNLIESSGHKFDYHDGYVSKGPRNLEARVRRAELIICPVDCNSHGACRQVKRLCKKYKKPLKILPSSSLSCISGVLAKEYSSVLN
jgi:hypothetical protein